MNVGEFINDQKKLSNKSENPDYLKRNHDSWNALQFNMYRVSEDSLRTFC